MNEKTNQVLSLSSALLIGALIGTGVGMLTAPRSGDETRSLIREKSLEVKDKASDAMTDVRDRAGRALDEIAMSTKERIPVLKNRTHQMVEGTSLKMSNG